MPKKKSSRKDRLAALQNKLKETDMGSGGSSGFVFIKPDSKVILRILPEVGSMEFFFQTVGRHYLDKDKWMYCPHFTSQGELECPVCELRTSLFNSGEKANKALSKKLSLRKSYWMNAVVRGEEADGVKIWTPGVTIINQIAALINDPDYGDSTDEIDGYDITVSRVGDKFDTEYNVIPKPRISPLSDDDVQAKKWLTSARDLSFVEVNMDPDDDDELSEGHAVHVYPYARIQDDLDAFFNFDFEDEEDDEDYEEDFEEEEEEEVAKKPARKAARKPVVEEEEDEDEVQEEMKSRRKRRGAARRRRK